MLQFLSNVFQRRPARIFRRFGAIALFLIQIAPAMWAQTFAVLAADRLQRQRQQDLLPQNVFKEQTFSLIITDLGLGCGHRKLFFAGIRTLRAVEQLEVLGDIAVDQLKTASARQLDPCCKVAYKAYVIDYMVLAVMLLDQLCAPLAVQIAFLPEVCAKVYGSGRKMLVKVHWVDLQFPDFDEHFGISAPPFCAGRGQHILRRKYSGELQLG
jgi:hypothetical protein